MGIRYQMAALVVVSGCACFPTSCVNPGMPDPGLPIDFRLTRSWFAVRLGYSTLSFNLTWELGGAPEGSMLSLSLTPQRGGTDRSLALEPGPRFAIPATGAGSTLAVIPPNTGVGRYWLKASIYVNDRLVGEDLAQFEGEDGPQLVEVSVVSAVPADFGPPSLTAGEVSIDPVDGEVVSVVADVEAIVDRAIGCVPSEGWLGLVLDPDENPNNDDPTLGEGSLMIESVGVHRVVVERTYTFDHLLSKDLLLNTLGAPRAHLRVTLNDGFSPMQHVYLGSLE